MTDNDSTDERNDADAARRLGMASINNPYKVLGEISDVDGIGVVGQSTASSGAGVGVKGITDSFGAGSSSGVPVGVYGEATATGGELDSTEETHGVFGVTHADGDSELGWLPAGVKGKATGFGPTSGVYGVTQSGGSDAAGVYGVADDDSEFAVSKGVIGVTDAWGTDAAGVQGTASASSGRIYGVRGRTFSGNADTAGVYGTTGGSGYGVHSDGNAKVTGSLDVTETGASVYLGSTQSISNIYSTVQYDQVVADDRSEWNQNGNHRFQCATAGDYHVSAAVKYSSTPAQDTELELSFWINDGAPGDNGSRHAAKEDVVGWTNGSSYSIHLSKTFKDLPAGHEIYVQTLQGDSGTNFSLDTGESNTYLTVTKVG